MVSKQLGIDDYEQTTPKQRTRRERFLAEMEAVVTWEVLIDLVEPHYPKTSSKQGPAGSAATITAWLCFTHAARATSSVIAGSWLKVSPSRKTGSSSTHTFGQSAGSAELPSN